MYTAQAVPLGTELGLRSWNVTHSHPGALLVLGHPLFSAAQYFLTKVDPL